MVQITHWDAFLAFFFFYTAMKQSYGFHYVTSWNKISSMGLFLCHSSPVWSFAPVRSGCETLPLGCVAVVHLLSKVQITPRAASRGGRAHGKRWALIDEFSQQVRAAGDTHITDFMYRQQHLGRQTEWIPQDVAAGSDTSPQHYPVVDKSLPSAPAPRWHSPRLSLPRQRGWHRSRGRLPIFLITCSKLLSKISGSCAKPPI